MDTVAVDEDLPLVRDQGPRKRLDQRRLAGAVVADDGQDLSGVELEIGAIQGRDVAVALDQATGLDDGRRLVCGDRRRSLLPSPRELVDGDGENDEDAGDQDLIDGIDPDELEPLRKTPTMRTPTRVPMMLPRPPKRLVPPRTTAVMLARLSVCPSFGSRRSSGQRNRSAAMP